jgi:hypothetical protein
LIHICNTLGETHCNYGVNEMASFMLFQQPSHKVSVDRHHQGINRRLPCEGVRYLPVHSFEARSKSKKQEKLRHKPIQERISTPKVQYSKMQYSRNQRTCLPSAKRKSLTATDPAHLRNFTDVEAEFRITAAGFQITVPFGKPNRWKAVAL